MIISIVIKAAASLATGVLALSSTRNMFETYKMIINHRKIGTYTMDHILEDSINPSLLQKYITCDKEGRIMLSIDSKVVSSQEIVNDLQHMSRKDLLRLFLLCDSHVDEKEIIGEWDGILLNNNSVLVRKLKSWSIFFVMILLFSLFYVLSLFFIDICIWVHHK